MPVERTEIEVMFLRTRDEPAEMRRGWERLEAAVGLRGRKFFGPFGPATRKYRVCVQVGEGDEPDRVRARTGHAPWRPLPPGAASGRTTGGVRADRPHVRGAGESGVRIHLGRASSSAAIVTSSTYYPSPTRQRRRVSSPATESADDQPSRASVPLLSSEETTSAGTRDGYISQSTPGHARALRAHH